MKAYIIITILLEVWGIFTVLAKGDKAVTGGQVLGAIGGVAFISWGVYLYSGL